MYYRQLYLILTLGICCSLSSFSQKRTLSRQVVFEEIGRQNANVFLEDSYGFIWVGASNLYRYDGNDMKTVKLYVNDSTTVAPGVIHSLLEDTQKRIWIGAANGLFQYDRETDLVKRRFINKPAFKKNKDQIYALFEDSSSRLWVGDRQHLYMIENYETHEFTTIKGIELGQRPQGALGITTITEFNDQIVVTSTNGLWVIQKDLSVKQLLPEKWQNRRDEFQILDAKAKEHILWLATNDGLWKYDMNQQVFTEKSLPQYAGKVILSLTIGAQNELWLGLQGNGLLRIKKDIFEHFPHDSDNAYSLLNNRIRALIYDRFNNLWIGTLFGVNKINLNQQIFPFYQIDPGPYKRDNYTFRVMEDSLGGFWFRLMRLGLGYSAGLGRDLEILLQPNPSSQGEEVKDFCLDPDGNIWVITLTHGLYKFKKGETNYRHINLGDSMKLAYCYSILSDNTDERYLWFSGKFGLCKLDRYNLKHKWFSPKQNIPFIGNSNISGIIQSEDGNIWFIGIFKGKRSFIYFDRKEEKFIAKINQEGHPSSLHFSDLTYYNTMPGNKIWKRIDDGVAIIDTKSKTYQHLSTKDGFPVNKISNVIADQKGNIWFTNRYKVCKYDGTDYQCYDARKDIEGFNKNSVTIGKDGKITFGGANGIYSFYPDSITFRPDSIPPIVYLSNFKVFNRNRRLGKANELMKEIRLPYDDNIFSLEYSALHFLNEKAIHYKHRLEPFEKDWVETGSNERQATYTNLSPGKYSFKVIAANADGIWTPEDQALSISIIVQPPWFRTWWAYSLWVLLALIGLFSIYHFQLSRRLHQAENKRLKELDQLKTQLYTNITHEFRTPLTVIEGMNQKIAEKPEKWVESGTDMIRRNTRQLLRLINQMLDLSKLESGRLELHTIQGDIIAYISYVLESFDSLAKTKDIQLHILPREEALNMDYDPARLIDIISNLLSNAIKFTPEGGDIYIFIETERSVSSSRWFANNRQEPKENYLILTVKDTGSGISPQQLPHIFDRFYQADSSTTRKGEGTGIGLALTKELVKLMGGEITVKSVLREGSEFSIMLPIRHKAPIIEPPSYPTKVSTFREGIANQYMDTSPAARTQNDSLPQILIIEDNADVVNYLISCLEMNYQIEVANNGKEGISKALESVPDLIISDVMMPEKDGFEVCGTLKKDPKTSHVPIILLTAKADIDAKIEGLETGADAYLPKPFNEEELQIRLRKLLELRKMLQAKYSSFSHQETTAISQTVTSSDIEDVFLQELRTIIEAHLTDKDLNVTKLCKLIGMSRTQLHRKLDALTGKSTTRFVKEVKLAKAAKLLKTTELLISHIGYEVGFENANWFSRAFSEVYGMSPKQYRENSSGI